MSKPIVDFIFVGPSKTASTWVYNVLRAHPEVYVPDAKDLYFFDKYYAKGIGWYESFFSACPVGSVCGELSHDYFSNFESIKRIYDYNKGVKLICILRDPFDRAYSSYKHMRRLGVTEKDFHEVLKSSPFVVNEGLYYTNISSILSIFDRSSLLLIDFDILSNEPDKIVQNLYSFLGVNHFFEPPVLYSKVNQARDPRILLVAKFGKAVAVSLRHMGFPNLVGKLKHNRMVNNVFYKTVQKSGVYDSNAEYPDKLISQYNFELDRLSDLLGRDFSKWKR